MLRATRVAPLFLTALIACTGGIVLPPPDAGSSPDGGLQPDAGPSPDGGLEPDAGAVTDAGSTPETPPASSAAPYRSCGALGAGALAQSALSPDGEVLATTTLSGQLILFRRADGSRLATLFDLPGQQVGVAFSTDGTRLVAASQTDTRVWTFPGLEPIRTLRSPHSLRTTAVALSSDGALVATGGFDADAPDVAVVRIWSVESGAVVGTYRRVDEQVVRSLAFSPDGSRLAISTAFVVTVRIPDGGDTRNYVELVRGPLAWSPDGSLLASGGVVVRVSDGVRVKGLDQATLHEANAFSPDGTLYAAALDAQVKLYRVSDWTRLALVTQEEPSAFVSAVAFTPDGKELVVDSGVNPFACNGTGQYCSPWGNRVRFRSTTDLALTQTLELGPAMHGPLEFSPDGTLLASATDEGLGVWRTSDLSQVARLVGLSVARVQFSPDNSRLRAGNAVYNLASGERVMTLQPVTVISPDFERMAVILSTQVELRELATGTTLSTFPFTVAQATFSPDGSRLALLGYESSDSVLRIVDLSTGTVGESIRFPWDQGGTFLNWSPDGRWLSSTRDSDFTSAVVVDLELGTVRAQLDAAFAAAFSPDSSLLVTGGAEPIVPLLRTTDLEPRELLLGHGTYTANEQWPRAILAVTFAHDARLATLGADRTVRLWCSP